jgi:hypothetical protein
MKAQSLKLKAERRATELEIALFYFKTVQANGIQEISFPRGRMVGSVN